MQRRREFNNRTRHNVQIDQGGNDSSWGGSRGLLKGKGPGKKVPKPVKRRVLTLPETGVWEAVG